jgi:CubicO group peptidase (beta-lactamase class C family)
MSIISLSKALTTPKISYPELSSTLKGVMQRCGIPGMSLAVLHKNQVIFAEGFGKRNKTDPYTVDVSQWDRRKYHKEWNQVVGNIGGKREMEYRISTAFC